jgi:hypothetical protein
MKEKASYFSVPLKVKNVFSELVVMKNLACLASPKNRKEFA